MTEKNASKTEESGERIKVKNAFNPVLWMCGIISAPTLGYGAYNPELPIWLIVVGCAPVAVALYSYVYFMHNDADRLHSEEFQIQKRTIEMAQQKGAAPIEVNKSLVIENPQLLSIGTEQDSK
ncbi:hypothetical protein [Pseudomonas atacamensis]|uniref:hypothetical protein n=1 Tax=Pseudomonas atacamensis TaxID=2565368 RepID=UPI00300F2D10